MRSVAFHAFALERQGSFEVLATAKCISGGLAAFPVSRQAECDPISPLSRPIIVADFLCLGYYQPIALRRLRAMSDVSGKRVDDTPYAGSSTDNFSKLS
ncbi:MAG TPA: hypothetical protein VKA79_05665 [Aestuariivirgaceae bacterium]|nr:hypothetical protein [Aestuariivirgaceae bacterium]